MTVMEPAFELRLAASEEETRAAQRLRYDVFVRELGGDGPLVDHAQGLERDRFDAHADHLLLLDRNRAARGLSPVVGVYRLMREEQARAAGGFYSASEYDLGPLLKSGRRLLELGRSCLHPDYRGGAAMMHLWSGLADYVQRHAIELMFGVASFHGTDVEALAEPLSLLHARHLAPEEIRPRALAPHCRRMDMIPPEKIDRRRAMLATPALIKAYLRLGGFVGEGAFVDHAFNTTDVCLVLDTARLNPRQREIYTRRGGSGGRRA
jgi:putative hemolysin